MLQSGDLKPGVSMTEHLFREMTHAAVDHLDIAMARKEVEPFVKNPDALKVWSAPFFRDILQRIILV